MSNPFESIEVRLINIEALLNRVATMQTGQPAIEKPDLGMLDMAVEVTGKSRQTIYNMVMRREIPFIKKGKHLYFSRKELNTWILSGRVQTNEELQTEAATNLATRLRKSKR